MTFDEYDLFAKANNQTLPDDKGWGRGKRPVIKVSWKDATAYASWLSEVTGKSYRLPSEAEWEYTTRAGTTSEYYWGDSANDADNFAWFGGNSEGKTHPVGKKQPNAFGLYDLVGNVWEWMADCWHHDYEHAPDDGIAWETGDCTLRVLRGGSWSYGQDYLRSAFRFRFYPGFRYDFIGFHLAQD